MSNLVSEVQWAAFMQGVLIPSIVAGLAYIVARLLPIFLRGPVRAVAVISSVVLAYVSLLGLPELPLWGSPKGLLIASGFAILWACFEKVSNHSLLGRRFFVMGLVGVVCTYPLISSVWSLRTSIEMGLLIATVGTSFWWMVERGGMQMQSAGYLATLVNWATVSSLFFMLEGSASLAQVAGALCSALGAAMLLALFKQLKPEFEFTSLTVILVMALWCCHGFYTDSSLKSFVMASTPLLWFAIRGLMTWTPKPLLDLTVSSLISILPAGYTLWQLILKEMLEKAVNY